MSEEKIFERITLKIAKKRLKRAITPTWLNRLNENLTTDISHCVEQFYPVRIWLNLTVLEIYAKLLSDPYVLFLVTANMFFDGSKIPTSVLCTILQGTFIPSLVSIGQVVSEEKIFEILLTTTDDDDWHKVMAIAHLAKHITAR